MRLNWRILRTTAALVALLPGVASAHPGHGGGFSAGFLHPLMGLDHMIAMLAIGLWAAKLRGKAVFLLPVAFMSMMMAGGAAALGGVEGPVVEPGIIASVLVLGLIIATGAKLPIWVGMAITCVFAWAHGAAHGNELDGSSPGLFAAGAMVTCVMLHAVGALIGFALNAESRPAPMRIAGGVITASGLLMAVGAL